MKTTKLEKYPALTLCVGAGRIKEEKRGEKGNEDNQ